MAKSVGHVLLKLGFATQLLAIAFLVSGIKSTDEVSRKLQDQLVKDSSQFTLVGKELVARQNLPAKQFNELTYTQFEETGRRFFENNYEKMFLSLKTNFRKNRGYQCIIFITATRRTHSQRPQDRLRGLLSNGADRASRAFASLRQKAKSLDPRDEK